MAPIVPTLRHERRLWNEGLVRVVGVDEVGVAPTCGAVVAAAVIMRPGCHRIPGVRDSKTLSAAPARAPRAAHPRRAPWRSASGAASVREIDQLNIYHATHLAMRRAIARVGGHEHVLVDGNRIAGFEAQVGPYTNIVDGDAKVYSIACASVVAKVVRDRMMDAARGALPGLRLGAQPGLRDAASTARRSGALGPHAVPSPLVPGPPADARRRPARARPAGRPGGLAPRRTSCSTRELVPVMADDADARRARPGVAGADGAGLNAARRRGPAVEPPIRAGCDDAAAWRTDPAIRRGRRPSRR